MNKPDGHPEFPVWKLERFLLGELPAAEMERIRAAQETDPSLASWIQALQAEYRDLETAHPTGRVAGRIWNRLRVPARTGRPAWSEPRLWMPALGLLLIVALIPSGFRAWVQPMATGADGGREETRLKGLEPKLYLYRKTGETVQSLASGDRVRPGDLIQIHYDAAGRGYGAIFSLDRAGKVTWHLPDSRGPAAALESGPKIPLGFAFELDSTPGAERFWFIASSRPFALDSALSALSALRAAGDTAAGGAAEASKRLALPDGIFQTTFEIHKETGI